MTDEEPPEAPARDDDPARPPPRPVAPPGQVSTPDQLPTVEPGEWPAQPPRAQTPPPPPPPAPQPLAPLPPPLPPAGQPAASYPPRPAAPRSFLGWWVALAAVVVLGVGTATTLAFVRPWDGDTADGDRDISAVPQDSEQPEQPEQAEPSDLPGSTPTAPPTTVMPTQPPPAGPVTGDLDGDGLGDAAAVFGRGDDVERFVLSSTGASFKVGRERLPDFQDRTWADFDGDGALDQITWAYQLDGRLALTSPDLDFGDQNLPLRLDAQQPYVTVKPGDFDGDGAIDLIAYGATALRTVSVWMIRNDGGGFAEPEVWMQIPNTTYARTTLLPADFTGDGLTDVAARVPKTQLPPRFGPNIRIRYGVSLLLSTGTVFAPGAIERPTPFLDSADAAVGDFVGDESPRVLLVGRTRDGIEVQALRRVGDRFLAEPQVALRLDDKRAAVVDTVVSDVDGDRVDDVVFTTATDSGRRYGGFRVLRLGASGVANVEDWARTPTCPSGDCSFYFQNS